MCSSSQEILCVGSNGSGAALQPIPCSSQSDNPSTFTPTLAAHFDENLIKHIQGWPSENTEKQVASSTHCRLSNVMLYFLFILTWNQLDWNHKQFYSVIPLSFFFFKLVKPSFLSCQAARLHEDIHNMGSLYMSEICTEMKNLRSLVRVSEIQATLREQRWVYRSSSARTTHVPWSMQVYTIMNTFIYFIPESCFWGSRAKSWTSWRTRTPTWSEDCRRNKSAMDAFK